MEKIWDKFEDMFYDALPEEKEFFHEVLITMEDMKNNIVAIQRALDLMCKSVEHSKAELKGRKSGHNNPEVSD